MFCLKILLYKNACVDVGCQLVITVHDAPHLCVCEKDVKCFIVLVAMRVMC